MEGQRLTVPAGVMKNTHNASTFRPYDPSNVIGDVGPAAKPAAKQNKCGAFGAIMLVAVAVAVAVVTSGAFLAVTTPGLSLGGGISAALGGTAVLGPAAGLAAGKTVAATAFGLMAGGALGGAAGSIASQGLGLATGMQDKFSWKGVAMAALSGGVGAGVGQALPMQKIAGSMFLANAARGAAGSLGTQGIAVATGLQDKFDWAGIAAAGIGSGVAAGVAKSVFKVDGRFARTPAGYGQQAASSMAGAIANGAMRSLIDGSSFGDNVLAAFPDVIGSTLGNMVADGLRQPRLAYDLTGAFDERLTGGAAPASEEASAPAAVDLSQMPPEAADIVVTAQRFRVQTRELLLQLSLGQRDRVHGALVGGGTPYLIGSSEEMIYGQGDIPDGLPNPRATLAGAINEYAFFREGTADDLAAWLLDPRNGYVGASEHGIVNAVERLDWESHGNDLMLSSNIAALHATGHPVLARVALGLEEAAAERWLDGGMQAAARADAEITTLIRTVNPIVDNLIFARDVISGEASRAEMAVRGGGVLLSGAAGIAGRVIGQAESRTARAARLGREGEAAVGLTGRRGVLMGGRMRFPDGIDDVAGIVSEVKNVRYQGWTRQLQDYSAWAKDKGYTFELWVRGRQGTELSSRLIQARTRGDVVIRYIEDLRR